MARVLILYYSACGYIETMGYAVMAKSAGVEVTVKRVPDLVPEEVAKTSNSNSIRKLRSQPSPNLPTAM